MGMEHGGGPAGMHGAGPGMGDAHGMRQGMWSSPGGGPGMHPPHGQGKNRSGMVVGFTDVRRAVL